VARFHFAQHRDRWRALVNAMMNLRVLAPRIWLVPDGTKNLFNPPIEAKILLVVSCFIFLLIIIYFIGLLLVKVYHVFQHPCNYFQFILLTESFIKFFYYYFNK
jgi:hypothetical protein